MTTDQQRLSAIQAKEKGERIARRKHINNAADALSDLNIFSIVQEIAGGSFLRSGSQNAAQRIVRICRAEQQRLLTAYDAAISKAGGADYGEI